MGFTPSNACFMSFDSDKQCVCRRGGEMLGIFYLIKVPARSLQQYIQKFPLHPGIMTHHDFLETFHERHEPGLSLNKPRHKRLIPQCFFGKVGKSFGCTLYDIKRSIKLIALVHVRPPGPYIDNRFGRADQISEQGMIRGKLAQKAAGLPQRFTLNIRGVLLLPTPVGKHHGPYSSKRLNPSCPTHIRMTRQPVVNAGKAQLLHNTPVIPCSGAML